MHEVHVVTTHAVPTAVVARSTTWADFPSLWIQLLDQVYVFLKNSTSMQAGRNVMLYKDDVPNVEVGVEVQGTFPSGGPVVASVLPAGEAAATEHRGSYAGLDAAHRGFTRGARRTLASSPDPDGRSTAIGTRIPSN